MLPACRRLLSPHPHPQPPPLRMAAAKPQRDHTAPSPPCKRIRDRHRRTDAQSWPPQQRTALAPRAAPRACPRAAPKAAPRADRRAADSPRSSNTGEMSATLMSRDGATTRTSVPFSVHDVSTVTR